MDRKDIPSVYMAMKQDHPQLMQAYESLGQACTQAGPLDRRTVSLIKLGISMAAGLEGAAHSHARKALEAGCTADELMHVAILLTPTVGFPSMMRARKWVQDLVGQQASTPGNPA